MNRNTHKRKSLLSLILIALIILGGCSSQVTAVKKSDTELAKEAISGFNEAMKKLDTEGMKKYVVKEKASSKETTRNTPETEKAVKELFSDISYTYKSGTIEEGATSGTLNYEIKARDLTSLVSTMIIEAMSGKTQEEIIKGIDKNSLPFKSHDVAIDVVKEDGEWKIKSPDIIVFKYMGFDQNPFGNQ